MKRLLLVHGAPNNRDYQAVREAMARFKLEFGDLVFTVSGAGTGDRVKQYLDEIEKAEWAEFSLDFEWESNDKPLARNHFMFASANMVRKHCGFTLTALAFPSLDEPDVAGTYDFIDRCKLHRIEVYVLPLLDAIVPGCMRDPWWSAQIKGEQ